MTVTTGLSKKVGTANYGSVGATCSVTFEADHNLLERDLEGFQQRVRNAFAAAHQAVTDQLARELNTPSGGNETAPSAAAANSGGHSNGNGATGANGNAANGGQATGPRSGNNGHTASGKQLDYARQLAKQIQGLGVRRLETLAQKMYHKPLTALTSMDASGLIDTLKSIKDGKIDLNSVLEGNAA
jgi:hypothetical protein